MASPTELGVMLDTLEAKLPEMIAAHRAPGEFWMAFAGEADVIEDRAGEHAPLVNERIARMLAEHGYYVAAIDIDEGNTTGEA